MRAREVDNQSRPLLQGTRYLCIFRVEVSEPPRTGWTLPDEAGGRGCGWAWVAKLWSRQRTRKQAQKRELSVWPQYVAQVGHLGPGWDAKKNRVSEFDEVELGLCLCCGRSSCFDVAVIRLFPDSCGFGLGLPCCYCLRATWISGCVLCQSRKAPRVAKRLMFIKTAAFAKSSMFWREQEKPLAPFQRQFKLSKRERFASCFHQLGRV